MTGLVKPIVGYYGLIDDARMDLELMRKLAKRFGQSTFVYLGPLQGVSEKFFNLPNMKWLGHKSYDQLPSYLNQFDIAIIPFRQTSATAFIHPTKILEYMADGGNGITTTLPDIDVIMPIAY